MRKIPGIIFLSWAFTYSTEDWKIIVHSFSHLFISFLYASYRWCWDLTHESSLFISKPVLWIVSRSLRLYAWRLYRWSVCETWSMLGFRKVVSNSSLLFSNSHTNLSRFLRYRNSSSSLIKFFLTCAWILLMGTCNLIPLSLLCGTQHYVIQD